MNLERERLHCRPRPRVWSAAARADGLTTIAMVAAATAALMGLALPGAYDASTATAQALRGYDLVTLTLVVPLLAACRGRAALLFRPGLLAYLVYSYLLAAVTGGLGAVFLLDVVVLSSATYALAMTASPARSLLGPSPPRSRVSAVILAVLAFSLAAMWLGSAVVAATTGETPEGSVLVESGLTVRLGIVLDLWLLVPLYALSAALLWRQHSWGRNLGLLAVGSGILHQLSYMSGLIFQARADVPGAQAFDPLEPVIVAGFVVALLPLLKGRPTEGP